MGLRVGVDVGGTFTKAVAFELGGRGVVAQAVVPTTHRHERGVAAGVVEVVAEIAAAVGADRIDLVVHSTTQSVNALLEGDTAPVGVIGLGRRPELKRACKRTELKDIEVAPGRMLQTLPVFFDVTDGVDDDAVLEALAGVKADGAATVCIAEAFAPDDDSDERHVADLAATLGLPACTSNELSGLYGLELRAITAALNASVLPIAAATAGYVENGLRGAGIAAPLMIMRGDGGATDMAGFRKEPARTLYSGPAASVAGALRYAGASDAVVVEIGGTSTNVAAIRGGQPALSYVQVGSHATALRSVDVRVVGAAGGSMLRVRRGKVYGVGPRSAHIAGLAYASFAPPGTFGAVPARAVELSPRSGDPADYLALETSDGTRWALTNTCAAVALQVTTPGDYAHADPVEAVAAFAVAGRHLGLDGLEVARRMLEASGTAVCELILAVTKDTKVPFPPTIVAVGGGAGGLGRHIAAMLGTTCIVPEGAEVISSIGDALSLLRAERERTVDASNADLIDELTSEVEAEVSAAGAAPTSIEVRVEELTEKGTVRAVAFGAVAMSSGALPGRDPITEADARVMLRARGVEEVPSVVGAFWIGAQRDGTDAKQDRGTIVVLDRWGDPVVETIGRVIARVDYDAVLQAVTQLTRHRGPVDVRPTVWVLRGNHVTAIDSGDQAATAAALASRPAIGTHDTAVAVIVGSN